KAISAAAYGRAYRKVDRRKDRGRQIYLIQHLGQSLDRLANRRFAGAALVLLRKPAQIAGFGDLLAFLERGYDAVHKMGSIEEFLTLVVSREKQILKAVFAGDDSVLSKEQSPRSK
ncbi:MAG: FFLEELY motif protein, partial [Rhizomicrobium sp.]